MQEIRIVFDGPPGQPGGHLIEIENASGKSIRVGEWHARDDGLWELRIPNVAIYADGEPMFAPDGTMLNANGTRSIFDDVDR